MSKSGPKRHFVDADGNYLGVFHDAVDDAGNVVSPVSVPTGAVEVEGPPQQYLLEVAQHKKLAELNRAYEAKRAEGFNGVPLNENFEKIITGAAASLEAKARGKSQGKLGMRIAKKIGMTEDQFVAFADDYGDYAVALWEHRDSKKAEIEAATTVEDVEAVDLTDWPSPT